MSEQLEALRKEFEALSAHRDKLHIEYVSARNEADEAAARLLNQDALERWNLKVGDVIAVTELKWRKTDQYRLCIDAFTSYDNYESATGCKGVRLLKNVAPGQRRDHVHFGGREFKWSKVELDGEGKG